MKGCTPLSDLVGTDDPVEPASMRFVSKPGNSCCGCLFKGQRAKVCREANRLAVLAGFKDCDEGVIYIAHEGDLKQSRIV